MSKKIYIYICINLICLLLFTQYQTIIIKGPILAKKFFEDLKKRSSGV